MALIYRAYFAFGKNPPTTSYGLNTGAMLGFANTLLDVLKNQQPTHIAVVFDTAAPTQRHIDFEAYKAHRPPMPEDLSKSIPYVYRMVEGFGIPVITKDGYEADDIIGTLAKKAERKGFRVYCMTPDKDFGQLVSPNIFMYKPSRQNNSAEVIGVPEILEKWEIEEVSQVIDILGLMGDAADNIPGIPGVGEKTAKKLIKEFGSVESIIANSGKLKGKLRENIENHAEQGLLSKKLATILLDVPVELEEDALRTGPPSRELLEPLFAELEFRTLARRVFGGGPATAESRPPAARQADLFSPDMERTEATDTPENPPAPLKTLADTPHEYILLDGEEAQKKLAAELSGLQSFCSV